MNISTFLRQLSIIVIVCGIAIWLYCSFKGGEHESRYSSVNITAIAQNNSSNILSEMVGSDTRSNNRSLEEKIAAGKTLYSSLCSSCHGDKARGNVGPDLTVSKFKYGRTRQAIFKSVSNGRSGGMPPFDSRINREQIECIVEFVLALK